MNLAGALLVVFAGSARAQEFVPPALLACPTPFYPPGLDAGPQRVSALLRIDERGAVSSVTELAGDPRFVALIEPVAATCTFTPALEDGRPLVVDQPFAWDWPEPPVNLTGRVITRGDRLAVDKAVVQVRAGDAVVRAVTTGPDGAFAFRNLGSGPLVLGALAPGFRVPEVAMDGPATAADLIEAELWAFRERSASDELVATYDPRTPGPTRRTLDRDAIRAVPGSLGDPMRALQSQPGFARTPFEAGWLLVRGGDPDDTGLYLDGVRIPLLYHMGGFTSVLHPELTDSVDYWAGAQPARLQGTAGAVDVVPARIGDRARAVAGVNLAWAHGFLEVPLRLPVLGDDVGFAVAARRSYLDGVIALALGAEAAAIAPSFADVQGTLRVGDATITGLWLGDALEVPSLDGGTLDVKQLGAQVQGRFPFEIGDGTLTIRPWIARHGRGMDIYDVSGVQTDAQALIERFPGLRVSWESAPTAELRLDTGFEAEYRSWLLLLDSRVFDVPGGRLDPWIQASMGRKVEFESGIRFDTLWVREQLPRFEPSPRTAVRVHLSDDVSVHGEMGRFHQIPEVLLLAGLPEGAYLPLERADLAAVGLRARRDLFALELDGYHRQTAWLPSLADDGTMVLGVGRAWGLESQLSWRPDPVALSVLYQVGTSQRRSAPEAEPQPALTDQPHRFQVLAVTHLPKSWTLSARFRYGSGFPRLVDPATGQRVPSSALDLLTQETVLLPDPTAPRLPPFHALDLKMQKEIQLRTWRLDVWIDVQNVYNRRVVEPFLTGFPESAETYGFGLPILPLFGVEGVWWPGRRNPPTPAASAD